MPYKKDKYGWSIGKVFRTKIHEWNGKYKLEIGDKNNYLFTKTYATLATAKKQANSYLKIKKK